MIVADALLSRINAMASRGPASLVVDADGRMKLLVPRRHRDGIAHDAFYISKDDDNAGVASFVEDHLRRFPESYRS